MLVRAAAILSLFAWLPLAHAAEQSIPAGDEGQIEFNTPSDNIGCIYTAKGGTSTYQPQDGGPELSCSRVEPSYVTIILGPKGPATLIKIPASNLAAAMSPGSPMATAGAPGRSRASRRPRG